VRGDAEITVDSVLPTKGVEVIGTILASLSVGFDPDVTPVQRLPYRRLHVTVVWQNYKRDDVLGRYAPNANSVRSLALSRRHRTE